MAKKKQTRPGSAAKLKPHEVHDIRRRIAAGESDASIAAHYSVDRVTIWMIRKERTWKWLK